jgi:hemin uptake protein HemP
MADKIPAEGGRIVKILDNKVKSTALLGKYKELIIRHNNEDYRLRITGNGKLILTK